jgi:ABC-2 type transport system permease protein
MRGVLEEKQTRVAEVVLASVPSDTLLMGKVIGIGAVGFTQLSAWLAIATGMMYLRGPVLARFGITSAGFALPELSPAMGVVILLTFLLGFFFYAALFAVVGAIVSTEQEAQQAQLPVVLLLGLTLSTVQGILTNPEGMMARVLTIVPFSSPIVLPLRLSLAPLSDRELILSLVVLALSAVAATFLAARLYRVGILMYGKRPTLKEAWRWIRAR